jgi:D-3-phosphoglycerate dehydrogenase / 2-oxoglutarate reductase
MRAVFIDASPALASVMERLVRQSDIPITISPTPDILSADIPDVMGFADICIVDHTSLPTEVALACKGLKHVVFLGTGARSYMDIEALNENGISVDLIKGYGDTAVAECAIGLMFAAAKGFARMDRGMREGQWLRTEALELRGKTLGLLGFGGIAREVARIALGLGMKVEAWNRSPAQMSGVSFVSLDRLLAHSDVLSLHLLLNNETRGFLSAKRIAAMRPGAILINTARGALIDEDALYEALTSGHFRAAGLDVFTVEPLPANHPLTRLENVTLSAHSAFRTPEASDNLIEAALNHCRRLSQNHTR